MANQGKSARRQRRGFALLVVLILIVMLAVLVYGLQSDVQREAGVSGNVRDDLRAAYLAEMALVRAGTFLRLDKYSDYDSLNEDWSKPLSWEGEQFGTAEGDKPTEPKVLVVDEDRKFNLLLLVRGSEEQQKQAAEVLMRLIEICRRTDKRLLENSEFLGEPILTGDVRRSRRVGDSQEANPETLVRNLVKYLQERVTEESDELEFGEAEGDARSMKKQTPFEMLTLGELMQIEGWAEDQSLVYGGVRKADEPIERRSDSEEPPTPWHEMTEEERFESTRSAIEADDMRSRDPNPIGIINFLTLYTVGRINVNTASREILLALDPDLTWDVVDKIVTARQQDRVDVREAEETGEVPLPEEPLPEGEEEEDNASFRAGDIANYAAFAQRVNNQEAGEGEQPAPEIEGLTEEVFNRFRPWLTVRSTVYAVEASATVGKITHKIKAVYRRTGTNQAPADPAQPAQPGQPAPPAQPAPTQPEQPAEGEEDGLPPQPSMKLTLLFRDVSTS